MAGRIDPSKRPPHVIVDEYGKRWWAWWTPTGDRLGGIWTYALGGGVGQEGSYVGPGQPPTGLPVGSALSAAGNPWWHFVASDRSASAINKWTARISWRLSSE
jgi:hypothetical protein